MREPTKRNALRKHIKNKFGTMLKFSFNVDCSESLVSRVVNGWTTPDLERATEWAEALNTDIKTIFPELVD